MNGLLYFHFNLSFERDVTNFTFSLKIYSCSPDYLRINQFEDNKASNFSALTHSHYSEKRILLHPLINVDKSNNGYLLNVPQTKSFQFSDIKEFQQL